MKKYLLIILCSLITLYAQAQTTDSTKTKNDKIYRNHIGINTQFAQDQFFNPNARTPLQLMYKRQNKKNTGAWRIGIGAYYRVDDSTTQWQGDSHVIYNLKTNLSIGYEKQTKISNKWTFYYGMDLRADLNYKKYKGSKFGGALNGVLYYLNGFNEFITVEGSLNPFLGIRYQLLPKAYVAIETNLNLYYSYYENHRRYRGTGVTTRFDEYFNNYGLQFKPYSGVYFFYQF
jgi:hypothetical protein